MFSVLGTQDRSAWRSALSMLPYDLRDVHLLPEWGEAHEAEGVTAHLAVFVDHDEQFMVCQPFLKRRIKDYFDLTSAGYGGPVTNAVLPTIRDAQLYEQAFSIWRNQNDIVSEFYLINPLLMGHQAVMLPNCHPVWERDVTIVPLGSMDEFSAHLRKNRIQSMDSAALDVVVATMTPSKMWELYEPAMRSKNAAVRWQFSQEYFERLASMTWVDIFGAFNTAAQRVEAGAVFTKSPIAIYYYLAAREEDARSGFADWCIQRAARQGVGTAVPWLHLGGGLKPGDSLEKYKRSFGGIQRPVYSVRRIYQREIYVALSGGDDRDDALYGGFFPAYRKGDAQ